jgi:hypothetical protein
MNSLTADSLPFNPWQLKVAPLMKGDIGQENMQTLTEQCSSMVRQYSPKLKILISALFFQEALLLKGLKIVSLKTMAMRRM